jgi:hypothetical protein
MVHPMMFLCALPDRLLITGRRRGWWNGLNASASANVLIGQLKKSGYLGRFK